MRMWVGVGMLVGSVEFIVVYTGVAGGGANALLAVVVYLGVAGKAEPMYFLPLP